MTADPSSSRPRVVIARVSKATSAAKLRALYTSLHDWIRLNPKEFADLRASDKHDRETRMERQCGELLAERREPLGLDRTETDKQVDRL